MPLMPDIGARQTMPAADLGVQPQKDRRSLCRKPPFDAGLDRLTPHIADQSL